MKESTAISITIDRITNSIVEVATEKSFDTDVTPLTKEEVRKIHKKDGWIFNWKSEFNSERRRLYKLTLKGSATIQGLLCIEIMENYIEMHLIENAPENIGQKKKYAGCAANLVAYACKASFDLGFDGFVSFRSKTELFDHYEEALGAEKIFENRMQIATESAKKLVNSYYKNHKYGRGQGI